MTIGYLLLHLLAIFVNPAYLWGVDSFHYFNPIVTVIILMIVILSFIEKFQLNIFVYLSKSFDKMNAKMQLRLLLILTSLFTLLSNSTHFLGDGYLRIRNLEGDIFLSSSEPLDNIIHWSLYKLQKSWNIFDGVDIYSYISIICGLVVVYNVWKYLQRKNYNSEKNTFFILTFLGIGSFQLFFGYVESYAISTCLMILFLLSSLETLEQRNPSIKPAIFFAFAMLSHTSVFVALPALLFVFYKQWNFEGGKKNVIIAFSAMLGLFVLIIAVLAMVTGESLITKYWETISGQGNLLRLLTNNETYGIFSNYHLSDILNQLLLISPALLFIPFIWKNLNSIIRNDKYLFLSILTISYMILILIFNPVLGYARDWDLFSFIAFPFTFLIVLLFFDNTKIALHKFLPLIIVGLIHTYSFIALNSSETMSLERAKNIAETPYWTNKAKALLYDELSLYYKNMDEFISAINMTDKAYQYEKNPRYLFRNANIYLSNNDPKSAEKYFLELVQTNNAGEEVYNFLADIYFDTKQFEQALLYYKQSLDLNPANYLAWNNVGLILMNRSDFENAKSAFKQSIQLNPSDSYIHYYVSICYFNLKDFPQALKYAEQAEVLGYKKSIIETLKNEILKGKK